jgi:hypothetical protein
MNAAFDAHFLSERKEAQAEARRIEAAKKDVASYSAQERKTQRTTPVKDGVERAGQLSEQETSRAIERKDISKSKGRDPVSVSPTSWRSHSAETDQGVTGCKDRFGHTEQKGCWSKGGCAHMQI